MFYTLYVHDYFGNILTPYTYYIQVPFSLALQLIRSISSTEASVSLYSI